MRLFILLFTLGLVVASSISLAAAPTKKVTNTAAKAKAKKKPASGDLQTDVKFDENVLRGRYQTPDEALAKVENEKGLADLLGVRKHFKDRLATASEQE